LRLFVRIEYQHLAVVFLRIGGIADVLVHLRTAGLDNSVSVGLQ
jgi:hypothetical protein